MTQLNEMKRLLHIRRHGVAPELCRLCNDGDFAARVSLRADLFGLTGDALLDPSVEDVLSVIDLLISGVSSAEFSTSMNELHCRILAGDAERALEFVYDDWNFGSGDIRHPKRMDMLRDKRDFYRRNQERMEKQARDNLDSIGDFDERNEEFASESDCMFYEELASLNGAD